MTDGYTVLVSGAVEGDLDEAVLRRCRERIRELVQSQTQQTSL